MTVLMFGWEFPPNISGGLGTACHGLTKALSEEKTNVLFVVPKLFGDEALDGITLISASNVPAPFAIKKVGAKKTDAVTSETFQTKYWVEKKTAITSIEVPSRLTAYTSPETERTELRIAQWNHPFSDTSSTTVISESTVEEDPAKEDPVEDQSSTTFSFSGGYGSNLMEEVERYAMVGAMLPDHYSFDVIHAHDWMTYRAGIEAKKKSGKPLVIHVHATEHDRASRVNQAVFAIEKEGMEKADLIITVSGWTKNILIERYKIPAEKIEVVHNGVIKEDSVDLPPPSSAFPIQPRDRYYQEFISCESDCLLFRESHPHPAG